jgi:hypothetical protein
LPPICRAVRGDQIRDHGFGKISYLWSVVAAWRNAASYVIMIISVVIVSVFDHVDTARLIAKGTAASPSRWRDHAVTA